MKYSESLKKNRDFQNVYKKGKSYANRYLVMYVLKNDTERNRLGISVSKKEEKVFLIFVFLAIIYTFPPIGSSKYQARFPVQRRRR